MTGVIRMTMTLTLTCMASSGRHKLAAGVRDAPSAVTNGQWVTITNASVRKVTSSEFEIRLAFAMCLLLWQLDSWTETCFWVIEILAQ
jgi:hypothetical protein